MTVFGSISNINTRPFAPIEHNASFREELRRVAMRIVDERSNVTDRDALTEAGAAFFLCFPEIEGMEPASLEDALRTILTPPTEKISESAWREALERATALLYGIPHHPRSLTAAGAFVHSCAITGDLSSEDIDDVTQKICRWLCLHPEVKVKSMLDIVRCAKHMCKGISDHETRMRALQDLLDFFASHWHSVILSDIALFFLMSGYDGKSAMALQHAGEWLSRWCDEGKVMDQPIAVNRLLSFFHQYGECDEILDAVRECTESVVGRVTAGVMADHLYRGYAHRLEASRMKVFLNCFTHMDPKLFARWNITGLSNAIADVILPGDLEEDEVRLTVSYCISLMESAVSSSSQAKCIELLARMPSAIMGRVDTFFRGANFAFQTVEDKRALQVLRERLFAARALPQAQRGEVLRWSAPRFEEIRSFVDPIVYGRAPVALLDELRTILEEFPVRSEVLAQILPLLVLLIDMTEAETSKLSGEQRLLRPFLWCSQEAIKSAIELLNRVSKNRQILIDRLLMFLKYYETQAPSVALRMCDPDLVSRYPPTARDRENAMRNTLAHLARFDTDADKESTLAGESLDLMRSMPPIMYKIMVEALEDFRPELAKTLSEKKIGILLQALDEAKEIRKTPASIIEQINANSLAIVPLLYGGHTTALVFYKDAHSFYYGVCNTGEGLPAEKKTIALSTRESNIADATLQHFLQRVLAFPHDKGEEFYNYLYEEGRKELGCSASEFTRRIEALSANPQKSMTCSLSSAKDALRLAWALLALDGRPQMHEPRVLDDVLLGFRGFASHLLGHYIERTYEKAHEEGMGVEKDVGLVAFAREKWWKKRAATEQLQAALAKKRALQPLRWHMSLITKMFLKFLPLTEREKWGLINL